MKKLLLYLAILFPSVLFAQGSQYQSILLGPTGRPLSGAQITVCAFGSTGVPCQNPINLFSDPALSQPISNPTKSDSLGNWGFWALPNNYVYTITGLGITANGPFVISVPCNLNSSCSGTTSTFAGLPVSPVTNALAIVTDGNGFNCLSGGGTIRQLCQWTGTAWVLVSVSDSLLPNTTVSFSATPSFNATLNTMYSMTLTGNVTSSTITGTPINGRLLKFHICQGAGSPWTFAFPANFINTTAIQTTSCTDETYSFDGTNWSQLTQPAGGGGGGGSCSSTGSQGTLQAAGTAGACIPTNASESNSVLSINESLEVKGLNPHVDATRYGVRALASLNAIPAISGITATTTATSPTVTVSTSTCGSQTGNVCFVNGDGVVLPNAGNSHSLTTPSAPTVTPFNSRWGTGTGDGVAAPAAGTSYNYKLFAFDLLRGRTAASSVGTTTTGPATLGEITYAVTGGTKANDTITFTGATQPPVSVGSLAIVDTPTQGGDNCYLGYWKVATVTGTGFTVAGVGMDTRNPMPANCLVTSNGGFTAHFFNYNQVTWPLVTGAYDYGVCSDRASPGTYHLLGTALYATDLIHSTNTYGTLEFDDFGATMTDANHVAPWEFSDSDCNAGSATNDDWQATIQSGAGSTTLTMTSNAPNSNGGGQPIRFDNSPTYLAARTAVGSHIAIMLPLTTGKYVFNSPLDLRSTVGEIMSAPQGFTTNAVVYFASGALYCDSPTPGSGSAASVQNRSVPVIFTSGLPGVQIGGFGFFGHSCRYSAPDNGTAVQYEGIGADLGSSFWDSQFASGSDSNDYMGRGFVCHNSPGTSLNCIVSFYGKTQIAGGIQSMSSHSATPSVICDGCGVFYFTDLTGFGRTMAIRARANTAGLAVKNMEWQGPSMPMFLLGGQQNAGNGGISAILGSTAPLIIDTSNWPCVSYIPSVGASSASVITYGGCVPVGTAGLQFTGSRLSGPGITAPISGVTGQNRDVQQFISGGAFDNIFVGPLAGVLSYSAQKYDAAVIADTSYPILINGALPSQPTCSVGAGGSVSIASHTYKIVPVWWNGGEGTPSNSSATCTTSGGNQQVTVNWTVVPGSPQGYNIYEDGLRIHNAGGVASACGSPQITPSSINSVVLTADSNCGLAGPSAVPSGGPTMMMPGVQGSTAPVNIITQYIDVLETAPPPNPTSLFERWYSNNSTHQLSCLTSSGSSCAASGGAVASPSLSVQFNNSGVPGGIPVPTSPNGVAQSFVSTPAGGVGVVAGFHLPGVVPRVTVCPSNLDTVLATDRAGLVQWNDASACAVTLPQAGTGAGTNNDFTNNFVFLACDIGAGTATVTPTTSTITYLSGGVVHSAQTTMPVATGQCAFTYSDNTNYFSIIIAATGVTSFTGDSLVYSNSASTGPVTLTLNTQTANKVFANCTGGTAAPTFCSIVNAMLPGTGATTVNGQSCALGSTCTLPPGTITVANAGTTGTTVNTLTKLVGAPSTAVITATTDTSGVIGITTSGAGTAGSAVIQLLGSVSCVFDGATIAGDYVQISTTTVGNCHDTNSATYPAPGTGDVIGRVFSTNGAAGTYGIDLFPQEINIATPVNMVTAASTFVSGNLVQGAGANKTTSDSGIATANVVTKIANGTAVLGTSAISSGACATVVTSSGTGIATTDVITVGFNTDPTAITGYGASATGAVLTIYPYPTTNNANFRVCNSTASSITPGALTLNWKVVR